MVQGDSEFHTKQSLISSRRQEKEKIKEGDKEKLANLPEHEYQMNLFQSDPRFERVLELLNKTDINATSPVEALLKLNEIKEIMKSKS